MGQQNLPHEQFQFLFETKNHYLKNILFSNLPYFIEMSVYIKISTKYARIYENIFLLFS